MLKHLPTEDKNCDLHLYKKCICEVSSSHFSGQLQVHKENEYSMYQLLYEIYTDGLCSIPFCITSKVKRNSNVILL